MLSKSFALLLMLLQVESSSPDSSTAVPATSQSVDDSVAVQSVGTDASSENGNQPKESDSLNAVGAPQAEAQEWTLRYRFVPDQKLRYQTHQIMTLEAQEGGNIKQDVSELKQRRVFSVLSSDESGAALVAMQFEHVWMKMQTDDRPPVVFDSTMKPGDVPVVFRHTAHQLKGSAPKYWLSNLGASLFEARKSAREAASAIAQASFVPSASAAEIAIQRGGESTANGGSSADRNADASDVGTFLMLLPEQPVSIGETWIEKFKVSVRLTEDINRQVEILRTFRLESVENGIAAISFRSSIDSPVRGASVQAQLIQTTPRGTLRFDIARGVMLNREMQFNESVIGVFGPGSALSSVGTNSEVLLDPAENPASESGTP